MRFRRDRRGQSVVVGTVILLGFFILALSLYQVQVVPQQNSQTEFQHFQEVQDDLVDVHSAVSEAATSERAQFPTVKLGTEYRTRVAAINPPDPAGILETSRSYNITITDESGETVSVPTRFIQYRPGYNELETGSIWYDSSALYLDERESGSRPVIIQDQNLVKGGQLRLIALQNEFRTSGTRRVGVELYPTAAETDLDELEGELTVEVPTRLNESDGYWESELNDTSVTYDGINGSAYPDSSDVSALQLRVDSPDRVSLNTVGIQSPPTENPRSQGVDSEDASDDEDSSDAGEGGESPWSETEPTEVSTSGGLITGVGSVNAIVLSEPRLSPVSPDNGEAASETRYFRLAFTVGDPPNGDRRYVFVFPTGPESLPFEPSNGGFEADDSIPITVFREDPDGTTTRIDELEIDRDVINAWYGGGVPLNLLDEGIYVEPGDVDSELDEIREYLYDNTGQEVYITDVTGRTDLTLDTRRIVDVQDDISPEDDDEFDVATRNFEGLAEGYVVVENLDSGESTSYTTGEGVEPIAAGDVGGLEDGDEIVATLYENDSAETALSTDQVFVGETPPARFGQLDAQSTTRGNSDNINTVTFDWTSSGGVASATFETRETDGTTVESASPTPPQQGSVTLDGGNNNQLELVATVEGSSGFERCTATISGETSITESDFTCTTE